MRKINSRQQVSLIVGIFRAWIFMATLSVVMTICGVILIAVCSNPFTFIGTVVLTTWLHTSGKLQPLYKLVLTRKSLFFTCLRVWLKVGALMVIFSLISVVFLALAQSPAVLVAIIIILTYCGFSGRLRWFINICSRLTYV